MKKRSRNHFKLNKLNFRLTMQTNLRSWISSWLLSDSSPPAMLSSKPPPTLTTSTWRRPATWSRGEKGKHNSLYVNDSVNVTSCHVRSKCHNEMSFCPFFFLQSFINPVTFCFKSLKVTLKNVIETSREKRSADSLLYVTGRWERRRKNGL